MGIDPLIDTGQFSYPHVRTPRPATLLKNKFVVITHYSQSS